MKLAYLVNTYPRASHSFIRREIAALERRGHEVLRLAMRSDRAALKDPADIAEDRRTAHLLERGAARLIGGAFGWMLRHPGSALRALRLALECGGRAGARLRHVIYWLEAAEVARRCHAAGVVHLHAHFGTNSATVAMLAGEMGGPRWSFTVHGPEEFDAPVALSLGEKIAVVHCGIEPDRIQPVALPEGAALVAIGRFAPQKGFALLIEALAAVPGVRLLLVGDGELRGQVAAAVAAHGLQDRVDFRGWQNEAGVARALTQAGGLVLPSFAEGLPVVIMEAMAMGRPVIATAIAGVPELVTPETGWLVPAGDAGALAGAIAALAATPPARLAAMGAAGRARVLQRHDIDREAARLAALFGES